MASLPQSPGHYLQAHRRNDQHQSLVAHLCALWIDAGLGDKEWQQTKQTFENKLREQPNNKQKTPGQNSPEVPELRWNLETFSIWLLPQGRSFHECPHWFRAFDFDADEMVSVADFIHGIVGGSMLARSPPPSGMCGTLSQFVLFRLLDLENTRLKDEDDLKNRLNAVQGGVEGALSGPLPAQLLQAASDFESFRTAIFPQLQSLPGIRLNVFST